MNDAAPSLRARFVALWPWKLGGMTGGMTAFFLAYFWVLHHPRHAPVIMPLTAVDHWIPFTPAALPLYLSLWIYVSLAPALAVNRGQLNSWWLGAVGLSVSGLLLFYVCPTAVPPPDVTWANDSLFAFLKAADASGNACPSLHVAFAVFTALVLACHLRSLGAGTGPRIFNALWCAGIAWSTLATRQHVFLDAVGGAMLGAVFGWLFVRRGRISPAGRPPG